MIPRPPVLILVVLAVTFAVPATHAAPDCTEAELIALEWTGQLEAPPAVVLEIEQHLAWIRAAYPAMSAIEAAAFEWIPGEVLVALTADAWAVYQSTGASEVVDLAASMGGAVRRELAFAEILVLEFDRPLHPERLAEIFEVLATVRYTDPNGIIGDGNDVTRVAERRYVFREGSGDCLAGCTTVTEWLYEVDAGTARLVSATGAPSRVVTVQVSQAHPNPFNPATQVDVVLGRPSHVRADLFDVSGRRVVTLVDANLPVGPVALRWTGTDAAGHGVASGVYLLRVRAGDELVTRRLTLIQ